MENKHKILATIIKEIFRKEIRPCNNLIFFIEEKYVS